MSFFRQIHTRMWGSDSWFAELPAEEKLLFIYLFSNERASVSGLYELPLRLISFETGLGADAIRQGLTHFTEAGKALYDFEKGVVLVRNMMKYQGTLSPKLIARMKADVSKVPDCDVKSRWLSEYTVLIGYEYGNEKQKDGIDTSILVSSPLCSVSEEGGVGEGAAIYQKYEREFGALTPMIADAIEDACKTYPAEWVPEAMEIAVKANKRSWKYVEGILKNCKAMNIRPSLSAKEKSNGNNGTGNHKSTGKTENPVYTPADHAAAERIKKRRGSVPTV